MRSSPPKPTGAPSSRPPPPRPPPRPGPAATFARLLALPLADLDPPAPPSRPRARSDALARTVTPEPAPLQPPLSFEAGAPTRVPVAVREPACGGLQRAADEMIRAASVVELPSEIALHLELEVPLLRRVGVELSLSDGRLRARLRAADRAGLDRLRAGIPELEAALEARGIAADRVEVISTKP